MRSTSNFPLLQSWIKACEVSKLPRNSGRCATDRFRQLYDQRIANVNSSEGDFAVEVEGDDELFSRPVMTRHSRYPINDKRAHARMHSEGSTSAGEIRRRSPGR